ncbi:MAG: NAD-dependent epimerase/dehydratase family protein [Aeromicrobium sp.]|uniref:NAD-dependent epimerase/dehydratase family protein n=1 Tax=Aeromicrobium sp. TaxID=1871063 RepID=UPI002635A769|nr:NAD-dependent epimerase/dehydratase family protein [Aeromicrobium sp.]MDF1706233.1 NAD-dependent epimerase/dehydratase family protein [Aeromicrobium sp.]
MRFVVTGAAGFIGSNITRRLLDYHSDADVLGIDSFSDYYDPQLKRENLSTLDGRRFRLIEADLNEIDLATELRGVNVIYHEAGQPGVRKSWGSDFELYTNANIRATQRLLEAARTLTNLTRFIYASSSSVYGEAETYPTTETDRPMPRSPYGVTKLAAEHLCSLYASNFGLPTVSLRYFTVYGPGQRPDMAFTRFITAALLGEPITVYGSGEQIREFTYVSDIVEANVLAATAELTPGSVINLSGGSSVSVNEVLKVLERIHGAELVVQRLASVPGDVFRTGGSTASAKDLLGWRPSISLEAGLRAQYDWKKSQLEFGAR